MKLFFFQALFWIFTGGLYLRDNREAAAVQSFSKPHIQAAVTEEATVRLKDIDVTNPLFIFK